MTPDLAVLLPSLHGGGAERVMLTVANGFAARGLKVDLVLAEASGRFLTAISPDVRLVDLGAGRTLRAVPALASYLRREAPAAMVSALNHANFWAPLARSIAGAKTRIAVTAHNVIIPPARIAAPHKKLIVPAALRWAYRRADEVICVSNGVAQDVAALTGLRRERLHVIYNPVDATEIAERAVAKPGHAWFDHGGVPVILGAGRMVRQKDFAFLIQAFARLRQQRRARLVIIGEGRDHDRLAALVRRLGVLDDVDLPGFVENPYAWMSHSKVFALTSWWEGFAMVLAEAMACGCSVVVRDAPGGANEVIEHGKWGRLVPHDDLDAMARALGEALDRPMPAHERATFFSLDRCLDGYASVLLGAN